jgi:mono/diheme cytochrome c family protein
MRARALIPYLAGVLTPLIAGFLFVRFGGMPVATKGKPLPLERFLAKTAQHAAMQGEDARESPIATDEPGLRAGGRLYRAQCAVCHGFADEGPTPIARGLFPKPPQLLPPKKGVTDDPIGIIYWKVRNGLRLTGMPGFEDSLSDPELWQVSLFLQHANALPPTVLEEAKR